MQGAADAATFPNADGWVGAASGRDVGRGSGRRHPQTAGTDNLGATTIEVLGRYATTLYEAGAKCVVVTTTASSTS
ncbi:MAG: hypothetical protein WCG47_34350 [Dermatophilaceae bacterium]